MEVYIFTKGRDGFLYPNINGTYIPSKIITKKDTQDLKQGIMESGKFNIKAKTIESFDKKYKILYDLH